MQTRMKAKQFPQVDSARGAPMGRAVCVDGVYDFKGDREKLSGVFREVTGQLWVWRVRLFDGAYDDGGAYWGGPPNGLELYCVRGRSANGGTQAVFCAKSSRDATDHARRMFPNATFAFSQRAWPPHKQCPAL